MTPAGAFLCQKCFDYEVNAEARPTTGRILAKASKDLIFKASLFIHDFEITKAHYHRCCCNVSLWFTTCRNVLKGWPHNHRFRNDPTWFIFDMLHLFHRCGLRDMLISGLMFASAGYTWLSTRPTSLCRPERDPACSFHVHVLACFCIQEQLQPQREDSKTRRETDMINGLDFFRDLSSLSSLFEKADAWITGRAKGWKETSTPLWPICNKVSGKTRKTKN